MGGNGIGLLAVHGGAGGPPRSRLGERQAQARSAVVQTALEAGIAILSRTGDPLEAVTAAVMVMEDAPELNAGRGCALTSDGTVELSASVANGADGGFAGVAGISRTCNPVQLARRLFARREEVLMIGPPADSLAEAWGLRTAGPDYFITEERLRALNLAAGRHVDPHLDAGAMGTVGAVARGPSGWLAAATSTGGLSGQSKGRVGDSPICGAGTWADNRTCAISATGQGEAFVRSVFAHEVHARMLYAREPLAVACDAALSSVSHGGGSGGCIALSAAGELAMPFNTEAMLRGWAATEGRMEVGIDPGECTGS